MTVQLPVLLWTVICFGALILILNNLLFKPMLAFMDRREERIARAAEKEAGIRRALDEAEEARKRFDEEERQHISLLAQNALADARREADLLLGDASKKHADSLERRRKELAAESEEIKHTLDENAEELARSWLSSLLS